MHKEQTGRKQETVQSMSTLLNKAVQCFERSTQAAELMAGINS